MEFIGGLIRTGLAAAAGGLVADGTIDGETINQVSGAIMLIATAAWSIWQKKRAAAKLAAK